MKWRLNFRSALATATVLQCEVYVEMLNGFPLWIAENEVFRLKMNES